MSITMHFFYTFTTTCSDVDDLMDFAKAVQEHPNAVIHITPWKDICLFEGGTKEEAEQWLKDKFPWENRGSPSK